MQGRQILKRINNNPDFIKSGLLFKGNHYQLPVSEDCLFFNDSSMAWMDFIAICFNVPNALIYISSLT